ncbi:MAG TPA: hypothetical protein VLS45_02740 [Methylomicrobium sp.]|nr:hypothetical protein [Methylomicrobium sp.]
MATATHFRAPEPLRVTGNNVVDDWRRFREQFENYELASDLSEASQEKRAAVFLTCIGNDAYDVYRAMEFAEEGDRKKLDKIITAFEKFCVGAVNVTYERYVFNRRTQDSNERFDVFLGEIRRLARSCEFAAVEESMIRDRIVVGIHDDATRHKLLQVRDLTLAKAIDICKASEAARKQMKAILADNQVQALNQAKRSTARARGREMSRGRGTRDNSNTEAANTATGNTNSVRKHLLRMERFAGNVLKNTILRTYVSRSRASRRQHVTTFTR